MAEWLNAAVLKTVRAAMSSRVRIPVPPPVLVLIVSQYPRCLLWKRFFGNFCECFTVLENKGNLQKTKNFWGIEGQGALSDFSKVLIESHFSKYENGNFGVRIPSYLLENKSHLQLLFSLLPVWHFGAEEFKKNRRMIFMGHVTEFVGNYIIDRVF